MDIYRHHVSGFFAHREAAENTISRLQERGVPRTQVQLFDSSAGADHPAPQNASDEVLTNMIVDGAVGSAVGAGIGAVAQIALVAANLSLFIASPLIAPLVMLGWGASLGAFIGAAAGADPGTERKEGWLADLVRDAISNGQVVLIVETRNEQETGIARAVIAAAVGDAQEVVSA